MIALDTNMLVRFLVVDDPAQSARVRALPAPVKKFANATHLGGGCFTRRDSDKAVDKGRLLLAVEKYKNHEASLGKSAELGGFSFGQLMRKLGE